MSPLLLYFGILNVFLVKGEYIRIIFYHFTAYNSKHIKCQPLKIFDLSTFSAGSLSDNCKAKPFRRTFFRVIILRTLNVKISETSRFAWNEKISQLAKSAFQLEGVSRNTSRVQKYMRNLTFKRSALKLEMKKKIDNVPAYAFQRMIITFLD